MGQRVTRPFIIGGVAVFGLVALLLLARQHVAPSNSGAPSPPAGTAAPSTSPAPAPVQSAAAPPPPAQPQPAQPQPAQGSQAQGPQAQAPQAQAPQAQAPQAQGPQAQAPTPPSFDILRVAPTGSAVIAGRAMPGAEVSVLDGKAVVGRAVADGRGEWVIVPEQPLLPGNRTLSLSEKLPGGEIVAATGDVLLVVPEQPSRAVAAAPKQEGSSAPLALLVPRNEQGVPRPLQVPAPGGRAAAPGNPAAPGGQALALDIVEYDAQGRLALAGRADPGAPLNLYLGDRLIAQIETGADGRWSARPEGDIAPGLYQLRIDELRGDGKVLARVALPFQRAEPQRELAQGEAIVVQPGNSLWRIARRSYGAGMRYAVIYAANRRQIADPDLIYPGQVFRVPQR